MQDEPFDLDRAFYRKQAALRNDLEAGRELVTHPGAKGDGSELHWKEMLSGFLPSRYLVSKGFVVDSAGMRSEQIDVIIHDHVFSPLLWENGGHIYVPAESVYAVFEVKQEHSLEHIKYAGQKAASVRRRLRTEAEFGWIRGTAKKKTLFTLLAGLLTVDSAWVRHLATHAIRRLVASLRTSILTLAVPSTKEAGTLKITRIHGAHN